MLLTGARSVVRMRVSLGSSRNVLALLAPISVPRDDALLGRETRGESTGLCLLAAMLESTSFCLLAARLIAVATNRNLGRDSIVPARRPALAFNVDLNLRTTGHGVAISVTLRTSARAGGETASRPRRRADDGDSGRYVLRAVSNARVLEEMTRYFESVATSPLRASRKGWLRLRNEPPLGP
jgi:hypothetical protein